MKSSLSLCFVALMACAHGPAPTAQSTAPRSASISAEERNLYEIVLRLARDPAAQATLAPAARIVFHGEEEVSEPLTNAQEELGWIAEAHPLLIASAAPPADSDQTSMRCIPSELRCVIEQSGGETVLRFKNHEQRIVLSEIEGSEP